MKFEEVLPLMREGKIGIGEDGVEWRLLNGSFYYFNRNANEWWLSEAPSALRILREWTIKEEPKYQWLFRYKGESLWTLVTSDRPIEDCLSIDKTEVRRIDP